MSDNWSDTFINDKGGSFSVFKIDKERLAWIMTVGHNDAPSKYRERGIKHT